MLTERPPPERDLLRFARVLGAGADAEDVVREAQRAAAGADPQDADRVWRLLATIIADRIADRCRRASRAQILARHRAAS